MTGSFLESKRGDRCHFEEIKYVFPISHLIDVFFDSFRGTHQEAQGPAWTVEREGHVNDYIKVLAYRPSFSFTSKVVTLGGAHTLDLRPAFSFPGPAYTFCIADVSDDAREQK